MQQARGKGALAVAAAMAIGLAPWPSDAAGGQAPLAGDGGGSTCPDAAAVAAELQRLVPAQRLAEPGTTPDIVDQGAVYRVTIGDRVREYRDEARDCAQRARVAAIFVALTLDDAAREEPASPSAPPPLEPPATLSPTTTSVEAGARFDAGLAASRADLDGGLSLRAVRGHDALLVTAGASFLLPREVTVDDVGLRQWRLPLDLALRLRRTAGTLVPFAEGGVVAALISERALDLASSRTARSIELGVRAAVGVHGNWSARIAPFITLHAELIPRPPAIVALPRGVVGHTPWLWLGVSAGLSWGLP